VSDKEIPTHVFLTIELPAFYTADMLEGGFLAPYRSEWDSESEFILNCLGEPGIVKLRTEISGEKEGDVIEVWGSIRSASLGPATRGYGPGPHLTEEQLEAAASYALNPDYEDDPEQPA
jgi:hypothetical protein